MRTSGSSRSGTSEPPTDLAASIRVRRDAALNRCFQPIGCLRGKSLHCVPHTDPPAKIDGYFPKTAIEDSSPTQGRWQIITQANEKDAVHYRCSP